MRDRETEINLFFTEYSKRFNDVFNGLEPNIEGTAKAFSDHFIAANPLGVNCGKNDENFKSVLAKGFHFYKNIGITSMDVESVSYTPLDDYHGMAKVRWKTTYIKKNSSRGSIEFENIYFIQSLNNENKIFGYITGDEEAVLRKKGLV